MKKYIYVLPMLLSLGLMPVEAVLAQSDEGVCSVLGVHEPNSNIYDGPTLCSNTTLSYITVRGPLQLNKTTISGKTDVSGPIKINNSTLDSVVVEDNLTAETMTLLDSSEVSGNVAFLGKEGIIYLEEGSSIKGKIINAKVINQSKTKPMQ